MEIGKKGISRGYGFAPYKLIRISHKCKAYSTFCCNKIAVVKELVKRADLAGKKHTCQGYNEFNNTCLPYCHPQSFF